MEGDAPDEADGEGKIHRVGPNFGPTLRLSSGFPVRPLGQLANPGPTLCVPGGDWTEEDEALLAEALRRFGEAKRRTCPGPPVKQP